MPVEKLSNYKGSSATAKAVKEVIAQRYGEDESNQYDPNTNCLPYKRWCELGFKVKKGEKSLHSITFIDRKDQQGNKVGTYRKNVHLFYKLQVEPFKQ